MGLKPIPFRCERCGYDLTAVRDAVRCAECGVPTAESLPTARAGLPIQRRISLGAWLHTILRYACRPRLIYREVRIETRLLPWLSVVHFALAIAVAASPFAVIAAFGGRDLSASPQGGMVFTLHDAHPTIATFIVTFVAVLGLPMVWCAARWHAPRRRPPMAEGTMWASAAITSLGVMLSAVLATVAWLVRYLLAPTAPYPAPSPPTGAVIAMLAPTLFLLLLIIAVAIVDTIANRWNRLANTMDAR
jgi:hypothetical protein